MSAVPPITDNLLLGGLTAADLAALRSGSESVMLRAGDLIHGAGQQVWHVYFPVDGTISLAMPTRGTDSLDVAMVGYEGMLGVGLVLDSPFAEFDARVQTPGRAWRMDTALFTRLLDGHPAFRLRMNRYACVRLLQLAQDITCRNFHLLEGRLARQLLMARDHARSNRIALTHEALARSLGVRRAGVTLTASALQKRALMRYSRGDIRLLDVAALRAMACPCYASNRKTYARLLGRGGAPE